MEKRHIFWSILSIMMVAMLSIGLSSCSKDDDDSDSDDGSGAAVETSGSLNVNALLGKTFYAEDLSNNETENSYCEIKFKIPYFVSVHKWGLTYDKYNKSKVSRWDYGWIDCIFEVKGNTMTIHYTNDTFTNDIVLNFKNNVPIGYQLSVNEPYKGTSVYYGEAKPGTADMFGFYVDNSYSSFMKHVEEMCSPTTLYSSKSFEDYCTYEGQGTGWLIVDGNTISHHNCRVSLSQPTKDAQKPVKVYHKETVNFSKRNKTLYFYYFEDTNDTYKYVMNGSNVMISNGEVMTYNKDQLTEKSGNLYIKP